MKILLVSNTSWNLVNFRGNLISTLIAKGHEVVCLCKDERNSSLKLEHLGCKVFHLSALEPRGKNLRSELNLFLEIFKYIRFIRPDLSFFYTVKMNIYGGMASWIHGFPYFNNITGLGSEFTNHGRLPWILRSLYNLAFKRSCKIIFHNQEDLQYMVNSGICLAIQTCVIPGSGVDVELFQSSKKVTSVRNFLFSGRWLKEKGVCEFLEAAIYLAELRKDCQWILVGDDYGIPLDNLQELISKAQTISNIHFYPFTEDMRTFYSSADVFVLPSQREGLSKSVMEAMAMERIVLVSDVPGCSKLVRDRVNGYILPEISSYCVRTKMLELLDLKKEEIHDITIMARKEIEINYASTIIVEKYLNLIQKLEINR